MPTPRCPRITISHDIYYELTHHYLDTGQFGVVPIFAPFNYEQGTSGARSSPRPTASTPSQLMPTSRSADNLQKGVDHRPVQFRSRRARVHQQPRHRARSPAARRASRPVPAGTGGAWLFSADGIYSSGLRGGFADLEQLPEGHSGERRMPARLRRSPVSARHRPPHRPQPARPVKPDPAGGRHRHLPVRLRSTLHRVQFDNRAALTVQAA